MRTIIQRVKQAEVQINQKVVGKIGQGILILIGFESDEIQEDFDWMIKKITQLRIFEDESGVMNKSLLEVNGDLLIVSQFTLHANCKKGNRPSYIRAAKPEIAIPYYNKFVTDIEDSLGKKVQTGEFGADMQVKLVNDGPFTIMLDSKQKDL